MSYERPDVTRTADGRMRRVGFELEFSGLTLARAAEAVAAALDGEAGDSTAAERRLHVDGLGDFRIEIDWDYLKRKAAECADDERMSKWLRQLGDVARLVVPVEVVCPPIALDRLEALDPMVEALREAGATGTEESPIAAYGVHVNAEAPDLDAGTILSYLKAFCLLQWWLVETHAVNATRRLTTFIDLFPADYADRILSRDSADLDELFDDYLAHNATRNRALDLLPLLAEIDEARVRRVIDDPRIKARPAFHYRLPDCHIERDDWTLEQAWRSWWVVEQLAQRPDDLAALGEAYLSRDRPLVGVNRNGWAEYMTQWLDDHGLA